MIFCSFNLISDFVFRFRVMHGDHHMYKYLLRFVAGGSLLCGIDHLCLGFPRDDINAVMV